MGAPTLHGSTHLAFDTDEAKQLHQTEVLDAKEYKEIEYKSRNHVLITYSKGGVGNK